MASQKCPFVGRGGELHAGRGAFSRKAIHQAVKCSGTGFVAENVSKLLSSNKINQLVFVSDGMDARRCDLAWPYPLVIFDVSSASRLKARALPNSFIQHVPFHSLCDDWSNQLVSAGYRGDKPSLWILQGLDLNATDLNCLFEAVSMHAMKDSVFIGEFPKATLEPDILRKKLLSRGLEAELVRTEDNSCSGCLSFIAKQLRLSAEEVCMGFNEIQVAEEVDEDGFEEW